MTSEEALMLAPGMYIIEWLDGGISHAAVGIKANGKRWYAPTNWITVPCLDWGRVKSVEPLHLTLNPRSSKKVCCICGLTSDRCEPFGDTGPAVCFDCRSILMNLARSIRKTCKAVRRETRTMDMRCPSCGSGIFSTHVGCRVCDLCGHVVAAGEGG